MNKIITLPLLKKKSKLITFLILFCLFMSENVCFGKYWNRDYVSVSYDKSENTISIKFEFYDYEFGEFGEHGYLKYCTFMYSTTGEDFEPYIRCDVADQVHYNTSWLKISRILEGAKLQLLGCDFPKNGTILTDDEIHVAEVTNISNKAYLTIKWYVPSGTGISDIMVHGAWFITGLNCPIYIYTVRYPLSDIVSMKSEEKAVSRQVRIDQPDKKAEKVFSEDDAVVIKGVDFGQNIQVFTTSGALVKSIVADEEVVKIKLPANQMYIIKVGQARYKVAL